MLHRVKQVLTYVPQEIVQELQSCPELASVEELRLRLGQRVGYCIRGRETKLCTVASDRMLQHVVDAACEQSQYASQEMMKQGFLTLRGGHRLGLCGTGVYKHTELCSLRDITSLNLRIAREVHGVSDKILEFLWTHRGSVLIVGAPGTGKTTILRDLIRQMAGRLRQQVAVVDERMELGAVYLGQVQYDLGQQTDIMSGVRKATAIDMLLRSMSPQWIALDEITAQDDVQAIIRASYCGVLFAATAHAFDREDLFRRPIYRSLMDAGVFHSLAVIGENRNVRMEEL